MKICRIISLLLAAALCLLLCACGSFALAVPTPTPTPEPVDPAVIYGPLLIPMTEEYIYSVISPDADELFSSHFICSLGEAVYGENSAEMQLYISGLDASALASAAGGKMQALLETAVENAALSSDIYAEDLSVKAEVIDALFSSALESLDMSAFVTEKQVTLTLTYGEQSAGIEPNAEAEEYLKNLSGSNPDILASAKAEAAASLEYVKKHYTVTTEGYVGPAANPELFGITADPAVISALLETPAARQLTEGRTLSWSPETELLPESEIYYYLDETILALVWQEVTSKAVGTYAEIIIADGSQINRKLVDDTYGSENKTYATKLAQETNSVIAISGDLYMQPGRRNGIGVYEGQVLRFEPSSTDTMYVDYSGKLHFSRRNEIATKEDAQAFVDENNISFSVAFGPLMVYDYENVTPEYYKWGEIYDRYARCAFGEIDDNHYLALTINCRQPGYWYLVQLFDAKNAMMAHGCRTAYALDGGQTASIIINGELINPVQFGNERLTSDIIYFTTALPSYSTGEEG